MKVKNIFLLTIIFLSMACNNPEKKQKDKIEGLVIKNIDVDAAGTYIVSGNYSSSSTGGRLLEDMEVEISEKNNEIIVQLYPVFKSIGKDPIAYRVFSYIGQIPVKTYYSQTLTIKISDTAKSVKHNSDTNLNHQ